MTLAPKIAMSDDFLKGSKLSRLLAGRSRPVPPSSRSEPAPP